MNQVMLRLVTSDNRPADRLRLARAHIEIAIAHINNDAQRRVPSRRGSDHSETDALRVLVQGARRHRERTRPQRAHHRATSGGDSNRSSNGKRARVVTHTASIRRVAMRALQLVAGLERQDC
jgi:hypothetical protein